jgi:UDP-N-acetylmuramate--alanine ligase
MTHVHFIGIGGTGLSAIARVLLERGFTVSGSDRVISPLARELAEAGVQVYRGHEAANIQGADLVIRSSAVADDSPEVLAARQAGIPLLKRSDFLAQLTQGQSCLAVAGTHGKTTTTAMTAWVLTSLGLDPSYIIGGVSRNLGRNAHAGQGRYFVIEADEYDSMFLGLQPQAEVVTIVEHDHPDMFPTPADYQSAFERFVGRLLPGGLLLYCLDDPGAARLASSIPSGCQAFSYGTGPGADYQVRQVQPTPQGSLSCELWYAGQSLARVSLAIPGEHNLLNAAAVLALVHRLGLPLEGAARALAEFSGSGRRFEVRGVAGGVTLIDDYGHHPTEIRVNLSAARQRYPDQRIWAVWQPHTYSRTQSLLEAFAASFQQADRVIVTEVFAAREKSSTFSARQVVERMSHPGAVFIPSLQETAGYLLDQLKPGDVVLVFSAGDADQVTGWVFNQLQGSEANHDSRTTQAHV